tara:strand:- start:5667 stop:6182 length:516 start_codon:yes stop_codon:yes gene_type:complete
MKSIIRDVENDILEKCRSYSTDFEVLEHSYFNLISLKTKNKKPVKKIILSGGIHGSEPAGSLAIVKFLNLILNISKEKNYEFLIFPCLNPSGLEVNTRENKEGIDLNRSFDLESNLPEVVFLIDNINIYDFKADLSIDFHETCPEDNCDITLGHKFPKEFYMYEVCTIPIS